MHGLKRLSTCRERSKTIGPLQEKNGIVHDRSCSCACLSFVSEELWQTCLAPQNDSRNDKLKIPSKNSNPRVSESGRGPESTEDRCKVVKKAHGASCHDSSNNAFFTLYQTVGISNLVLYTTEC